MGYSRAKVGRYLGVTTSAGNRLAVSEELPDLKQSLSAKGPVERICSLFLEDPPFFAQKEGQDWIRKQQNRNAQPDSGDGTGKKDQ